MEDRISGSQEKSKKNAEEAFISLKAQSYLEILNYILPFFFPNVFFFG